MWYSRCKPKSLKFIGGSLAFGLTFPVLASSSSTCYTRHNRQTTTDSNPALNHPPTSGKWDRYWMRRRRGEQTNTQTDAFTASASVQNCRCCARKAEVCKRTCAARARAPPSIRLYTVVVVIGTNFQWNLGDEGKHKRRRPTTSPLSLSLLNNAVIRLKVYDTSTILHRIVVFNVIHQAPLSLFAQRVATGVGVGNVSVFAKAVSKLLGTGGEGGKKKKK